MVAEQEEAVAGAVVATAEAEVEVLAAVEAAAGVQAVTTAVGIEQRSVFRPHARLERVFQSTQGRSSPP